MDTPFKLPQRKLKKVLKKTRANLSVSTNSLYQKKIKSAINASLNTTKTVRTLQSNNRSLATSLERLRQDLRQVHQHYTLLLEENHELRSRILELQRIDATELYLEQEVNKRFQDRMKEVKAKVGVLGGLAAQFVDALTDLSDIWLTHKSADSVELSSTNSSQDNYSLLPNLHPNDSLIDTLDAASNPSPKLDRGGHNDDENDGLLEEGLLTIPNTIQASDTRERKLLKNKSDLTGTTEKSSPNIHTDAAYKASNLSTSTTDKFTVMTKLPVRIPVLSKPQRTQNNKQSQQVTITTGADKAQSHESQETRLRRETFVIGLKVSSDNSPSTEKTIPDWFKSGELGDNPLVGMAVASNTPSPSRQEFSGQNVKSDGALNKLPAWKLNQLKHDKITSHSPSHQTQSPSREKKLANRKSSFPSTRPRSRTVPASPSQKAKNDSSPQTQPGPAPVSKVSSPVRLYQQSKRLVRNNDNLQDQNSKIYTKNKQSSTVQVTKQNCPQQTYPADNIKKPDLFISNEFTLLSIHQSKMEQFNSCDKSLEQAFTSQVERTIFPVDDMELDETAFVDSRLNLNSEYFQDDLQDVLCTTTPTKPIRSNLSKPGVIDAGSCNEKKVPEAVTMRFTKPGQFVFAASRRESDGSRKYVPPILTKTRSKSKKQKSDMTDIMPEMKTPKSIFDFHDKTPLAVSMAKQDETHAKKHEAGGTPLNKNRSSRKSCSPRTELEPDCSKKAISSESGIIHNSLEEYVTAEVPLKTESPVATYRTRTRSRGRRRQVSEDGDAGKVRAHSRSRTRISQPQKSSKSAPSMNSSEDIMIASRTSHGGHAVQQVIGSRSSVELSSDASDQFNNYNSINRTFLGISLEKNPENYLGIDEAHKTPINNNISRRKSCSPGIESSKTAVGSENVITNFQEEYMTIEVPLKTESPVATYRTRTRSRGRRCQLSEDSSAGEVKAQSRSGARLTQPRKSSKAAPAMSDSEDVMNKSRTSHGEPAFQKVLGSKRSVELSSDVNVHLNSSVDEIFVEVSQEKNLQPYTEKEEAHGTDLSKNSSSRKSLRPEIELESDSSKTVVGSKSDISQNFLQEYVTIEVPLKTESPVATYRTRTRSRGQRHQDSKDSSAREARGRSKSGTRFTQSRKSSKAATAMSDSEDVMITNQTSEGKPDVQQLTSLKNGEKLNSNANAHLNNCNSNDKTFLRMSLEKNSDPYTKIDEAHGTSLNKNMSSRKSHSSGIESESDSSKTAVGSKSDISQNFLQEYVTIEVPLKTESPVATYRTRTRSRGRCYQDSKEGSAREVRARSRSGTRYAHARKSSKAAPVMSDSEDVMITTKTPKNGKSDVHQLIGNSVKPNSNAYAHLNSYKSNDKTFLGMSGEKNPDPYTEVDKDCGTPMNKNMYSRKSCMSDMESESDSSKTALGSALENVITNFQEEYVTIEVPLKTESPVATYKTRTRSRGRHRHCSEDSSNSASEVRERSRSRRRFIQPVKSSRAAPAMSTSEDKNTSRTFHGEPAIQQLTGSRSSVEQNTDSETHLNNSYSINSLAKSLEKNLEPYTKIGKAPGNPLNKNVSCRKSSRPFLNSRSDSSEMAESFECDIIPNFLEEYVTLEVPLKTESPVATYQTRTRSRGRHRHDSEDSSSGAFEVRAPSKSETRFTQPKQILRAAPAMSNSEDVLIISGSSYGEPSVQQLIGVKSSVDLNCDANICLYSCNSTDNTSIANSLEKNHEPYTQIYKVSGTVLKKNMSSSKSCSPDINLESDSSKRAAGSENDIIPNFLEEFVTIEVPLKTESPIASYRKRTRSRGRHRQLSEDSSAGEVRARSRSETRCSQPEKNSNAAPAMSSSEDVVITNRTIHGEPAVQQFRNSSRSLDLNSNDETHLCLNSVDKTSLAMNMEKQPESNAKIINKAPGTPLSRNSSSKESLSPGMDLKSDSSKIKGSKRGIIANFWDEYVTIEIPLKTPFATYKTRTRSRGRDRQDSDQDAGEVRARSRSATRFTPHQKSSRAASGIFCLEDVLITSDLSYDEPSFQHLKGSTSREEPNCDGETHVKSYTSFDTSCVMMSLEKQPERHSETAEADGTPLIENINSRKSYSPGIELGSNSSKIAAISKNGIIATFWDEFVTIELPLKTKNSFATYRTRTPLRRWHPQDSADRAAGAVTVRSKNREIFTHPHKSSRAAPAKSSSENVLITSRTSQGEPAFKQFIGSKSSVELNFDAETHLNSSNNSQSQQSFIQQSPISSSISDSESFIDNKTIDCRKLSFNQTSPSVKPNTVYEHLNKKDDAINYSKLSKKKHYVVDTEQNLDDVYSHLEVFSDPSSYTSSQHRSQTCIETTQAHDISTLTEESFSKSMKWTNTDNNNRHVTSSPKEKQTANTSMEGQGFTKSRHESESSELLSHSADVDLSHDLSGPCGDTDNHNNKDDLINNSKMLKQKSSNLNTEHCIDDLYSYLPGFSHTSLISKQNQLQAYTEITPGDEVLTLTEENSSKCMKLINADNKHQQVQSHLSRKKITNRSMDSGGSPKKVHEVQASKLLSGLAPSRVDLSPGSSASQVTGNKENMDQKESTAGLSQSPACNSENNKVAYSQRRRSFDLVMEPKDEPNMLLERLRRLKTPALSLATKDAGRSMTQLTHECYGELSPLTSKTGTLTFGDGLLENSASTPLISKMARQLSGDTSLSLHKITSQRIQESSVIKPDTADGKRRRAASKICYVEQPINKKLRRGDPCTSHYCTTDKIEIFKSSKSKVGKKRVA